MLSILIMTNNLQKIAYNFL